MSFKKVLFAIILLAVMVLPVVVFAEDFGLKAAADGTSLLKPSEGNSVPSLIGKLVGAGLSLIGVVFFGLILYGGIRWMTAMGRSEEVEKAKQIMEAAIIGLVIVLAAYAVTSFVINNLAGTGESTESVFDCGQANTEADCNMIASEYNCSWEPLIECGCFTRDSVNNSTQRCDSYLAREACTNYPDCEWLCGNCVSR